MCKEDLIDDKVQTKTNPKCCVPTVESIAKPDVLVLSWYEYSRQLLSRNMINESYLSLTTVARGRQPPSNP